MAGPTLPDIQSLINAGIDPRTGLPVKFINSLSSDRKDAIKRILRVVDEQDHITTFKWYNLPEGLDGDLMERILYYRGRGMFFYFEPDNKFYFLPFTLNGNIDVYGRFTSVTPLPFNGASTTDGKGEPWITGLIKIPQYTIQMEDMTWDDYVNKCVILNDYCKQISQTIVPRQQLNEPLLDIEAECIPFASTAMLNSTGVGALRVGDQSEQSNVTAMNTTLKAAALNGQSYVATTGQMDFQELQNGNVGQASQFLETMQAFDNFRLQTHGLSNGGLFQKSQYKNNMEVQAGIGTCGSVLQDKLTQRQEFCNVVNSLWGLGIWCEPSEIAVGADYDQNGVIYSPEDNEQLNASMEATEEVYEDGSDSE